MIFALFLTPSHSSPLPIPLNYVLSFYLDLSTPVCAAHTLFLDVWPSLEDGQLPRGCTLTEYRLALFQKLSITNRSLARNGT